MIVDDLDPWTSPYLSLCYDGSLSRDFLAALTDELRKWEKLQNTSELDTILDEVADEGSAELATGYGDFEFSVWMKQPGTKGREHLAVISATPGASNLDGHAWFDYVVGLYQRSVQAGRRPIYAVVAQDSGKYRVPPFTEQSVLADAIVELGWMHVFTPEQVETLGRERLLSAPATRIEELDDGSVALAVTLGDEDEQDGVAAHIGIEPPVGTDWFDDLDHHIDYVRHRAARRIVSLARNEAITAQPILDHLNVGDPQVRFKLARALTILKHRDEETIKPALRELATSDESEAVRSMGISGLDSDDVVRSALWDDSPRVQHSALEKLRRCPDEEALNQVVELLDSEYFQTRRKAGERLLSDRFFDSLPDDAKRSSRLALANCVEHEDDEIRRRAIEAAEKAKPPDYEERLTAALEDDATPVRIEAAKRYPSVHSEPEPAIETLLEIFDTGSFYADDAAEALASISPERALVELIPRLGEFDSQEERRITQCLESIVEEHDTAWVVATFRTVDPEDIDAAISVLKGAGNGDPLAELLVRALLRTKSLSGSDR